MLGSSWRQGYSNFGGAKTPEQAGGSPSPVVAIAERLGVSEARVLLRYAIQKEWAVLPKSLNAGRVAENIGLGSFNLLDADVAQLDTMETGVALAWGQPGQPMDPNRSE